MRQLILAIIFFSLTTKMCFPQSGWNTLLSGTTERLNKVCLLDENTGCIVGSSGTILFKNGTEWKKQESGTTQNLYSVTFLDSINVVAVGGSGTILRTTNAGESWFAQTSGTTKSLFDVAFINRNLGISVGGGWGATILSAIILFTNDGGENWQVISDDEYEMLGKRIFYKDSLNILVFGEHMEVRILSTADAGQTWTMQAYSSLFPSGSLTDASFADSSNGMFTFYYSRTSQVHSAPYKTTDGGLTWNEMKRVDPIIYGIDFITTEIATMVCRNGFIYRSTNGGLSWTDQIKGNGTTLYDVDFINPNVGTAVGENGIILHTTTGGLTSVTETLEILDHFYLNQNYPNPFNPTTIIEYSIPEPSQVILKIFDLLGRETATLVNEEKSAGSYEVKFDGSQLVSGVYFYRLDTGAYTETKKLFLIK